MRCDDIKEYLIDLLYAESGIPAEVTDHILACPACTHEIANLRSTRNHLQVWKDEAPASSLTFVPGRVRRRMSGWKYLRYAAIAAMVIISFLSLANMQITWKQGEFSFSTHLFTQSATERNYYTKAEMRDIMKRALDDTEFRMNEANYLMIQKMMDTVEQDRWADLHMIRSTPILDRNSN